MQEQRIPPGTECVWNIGDGSRLDGSTVTVLAYCPKYTLGTTALGRELEPHEYFEGNRAYFDTYIVSLVHPQKRRTQLHYASAWAIERHNQDQLQDV